MNKRILLCVIGVLVCLKVSAVNISPEKPVIFEVYPMEGYYGDVITISGINFGHNQDGSKVSFGGIECQDYDFDYVSWSSTTIKVKVPTGAKKGFIKVQIGEETARNQGTEFSIKTEGRAYSEPLSLTIDHSLEVTSENDSFVSPLYIWLPSAVPSDTQRDISLVETSGNIFERQYNELDLYKINTISEGATHLVTKRFSYVAYKVTTRVEEELVGPEYETGSPFFSYYTSPEYAIESDNERMKTKAMEIVGDETNPYKKARLIYDWVIAHMSYQYPPPKRDWRALTALDTRRGDCAVYVFLFCALARAAGIPARPVAGHVLFKNDIVSMHFWGEFYIPKYGWIPIDPNYGDESWGSEPKEFYFGNMDNRHIAFSKGKVNFAMPEEEGGKTFTLYFLQKYHAYMKNKPKDKNYQIARRISRVPESAEDRPLSLSKGPESPK